MAFARSRLFGALFVFALAAAGAQARPAKKDKKPPAKRDARTEGLGKSCSKSSECRHHSQKCIKQVDANGKPVPHGFCVLPCASFEAGTTKVTPGAQVDTTKKSKAPPPRCPPKYQCRTAGAGVPIDMCVRE